MESGCPGGQHVLFGRRTKFRTATGPTHQGLLILQRPLVRPVPCHGSAAAVAAAASLWSGDLSRLCCSASTGKSRRCLSLLCLFPRGRLNHRADPSVRAGVLGGNSGYRVRPGYSKFLHFIVSSPRQEAPCEAGLTGARRRRRSLPSGKAVNQTGRIYAFRVIIFVFYVRIKICVEVIRQQSRKKCGLKVKCKAKIQPKTNRVRGLPESRWTDPYSPADD